jgi:hypothetical protein
LVNPNGKCLVFPENLWFSTEPYQIPSIWPHIQVPRCRKPFGQPLGELHGISQNRCFFDLCGHSSNQSINQTIFFSMTLLYEKETKG